MSAWGAAWGVSWGASWGPPTVELPAPFVAGGGGDSQMTLADFKRLHGPQAAPVPAAPRKRRRLRAESDLADLLLIGALRH